MNQDRRMHTRIQRLMEADRRPIHDRAHARHHLGSEAGSAVGGVVSSGSTAAQGPLVSDVILPVFVQTVSPRLVAGTTSWGLLSGVVDR